MPNDCMGRPGDRSRSETPGNPPPDSFVMLHVPGTKGTGGTTIQVAKRFEAAIARVGDFDALAKLGERLPGRRGRARGRVATLEGHSERLYLRPARHGGALGFLWRGGFLGTRRARHELEVAQRLRQRGAEVSEPVLAATRRRGALFEAIIATVYIENSLDLEGYARETSSPGQQRQVAATLGRCLRRFHDVGGTHPDLHAGNLMIENSGEDARAWIIDLDRARVRDRVSPRRRMREIMRLHRSLEKRGLKEGLGRDRLAAFWAAYVDSDRKLRAQLLSHRAREWRRTQRHRILWSPARND